MAKKKPVKRKVAKKKSSRRISMITPIKGINLEGANVKAFETIVNDFETQINRYGSYANGTHEILNKIRNDGEDKSKSETPPVADLLSKFGELNYRFMKLNDLHESNLNKLNTLI